MRGIAKDWSPSKAADRNEVQALAKVVGSTETDIFVLKHRLGKNAGIVAPS
jgi:hypothetical protein